MTSIIDRNSCSVLHLRGISKELAACSSFEEGLELEVRGSGPRFRPHDLVRTCNQEEEECMQ